MGRKIIVAGIGTEVGKTISSAVICQALKADYWKPIQAGDLEKSDSLKIDELTTEVHIHPEAFKLNTPMSPHESARRDNILVKLDQLKVPQTQNDLIIELAGGLMVPINDQELFIDFVEAQKAEVILVASYYLGSINHTLLSLNLLKNKGIKIAGIIFNGNKVESTYDVIRAHANRPVLLEMKTESELTPKIIQHYANKFLNAWK